MDEATPIQTLSDEYWTEYFYYPQDVLGFDAVKHGLNELKENLPALFAFNNIDEIKIGEERFHKKVDKVEQNQSTRCVKVKQNKVIIKTSENKDIQVALFIRGEMILGLKNRPKIFIGVPLIETADYVEIPFVINSSKFISTKERDALASDYEQNSHLLDAAFDLYYQLLNEISTQNDICGFYNLIDFCLVPEQRLSQNPLWSRFNERMKTVVEEIVTQIPLVSTSAGAKEISKTTFPVNKFNQEELEDHVFDSFYKLMAHLGKSIPTKTELQAWTLVAGQLNKSFKTSIELYSINDLKAEIENFVKGSKSFPDFSALGERFGLSKPREFLKDFFEIIETLSQAKKISPNYVEHLLPSQDGVIGGIDRMWGSSKLKFRLLLENLEAPIEEELKQIAEKIGRPVRSELVDRDFIKFGIVKEHVRDFMTVELVLKNLLDNTIYRLPDRIKSLDEEKAQAWIALFRWCVKHGKLYEHFPIITKEAEVLYLEDLGKESFLVPFKFTGDNEIYEEIYPRSRFLNETYFENLEGGVEELLNALRGHKSFVTCLPIHRSEASFPHHKLASVLAEQVEVSKVDHRVMCDKEVISLLPLWNEVIGRVSDSPERAKLLFKFIVESVIKNDHDWKEVTKVNCACKDKLHKIFPSLWIASLKTDAWVPFKTVEGEKENYEKRIATKESLENLFSPEEFKELMKTNAENLIDLLPHFHFDQLDLKIKLHSVKLQRGETDVRHEASELVGLIGTVDVHAINTLIGQDPEGFKEAIKKLESNLGKKHITEENRKIGKNVEAIIQKIVKGRDLQLNIVFKGGDIEVWTEENEGWDSGFLEISANAPEIKNKNLIEIKFVSGKKAHLSKSQSDSARSWGEKYQVLVVENMNDLRGKLLEIDKNHISEDIVDAVITNSHIIPQIDTKLGDIPDPEEVEAEINGYWVKRKLWREKMNISLWIQKEYGK